MIDHAEATAFIRAGYDSKDVAGFLGWQVLQVNEIIRRYVSRATIAMAAVERMKRKGE